MPDFDLNQAVRSQFDGLIGRMRAKRLSEELPAPAVPEQFEPPPEESGEQQAIESMMGSFDPEA